MTLRNEIAGNYSTIKAVTLSVIADTSPNTEVITLNLIQGLLEEAVKFIFDL